MRLTRDELIGDIAGRAGGKYDTVEDGEVTRHGTEEVVEVAEQLTSVRVMIGAPEGGGDGFKGEAAVVGKGGELVESGSG